MPVSVPSPIARFPSMKLSYAYIPMFTLLRIDSITSSGCTRLIFASLFRIILWQKNRNCSTLCVFRQHIVSFQPNTQTPGMHVLVQYFLSGLHQQYVLVVSCFIRFTPTMYNARLSSICTLLTFPVFSGCPSLCN